MLCSSFVKKKSQVVPFLIHYSRSQFICKILKKKVIAFPTEKMYFSGIPLKFNTFSCLKPSQGCLHIV